MRRAFLLAALAVLVPLLTWAEPARVRTAMDYSLGQYGFTLAIALLGGLVSWFAKVRRGDAQPWSLYTLVGELATSALAGLLCFWLCEWAGAAPLLTAALVGICGHMGTRGISMFEEWATKKFGTDLGGTP